MVNKIVCLSLVSPKGCYLHQPTNQPTTWRLKKKFMSLFVVINQNFDNLDYSASCWSIGQQQLRINEY